VPSFRRADAHILVERIFEEAMSALLASVSELGEEHRPEIWVTFFEHIAEYERLYRALLGKKAARGLCGRCARRLPAC
jgi:hypothetical protein